jgi:cystathionine gamma-lyase
MSEDWSSYRQETRFIHAGQNPDPVTGALCTPISLSTTFAQHSPGVTYSGYEYSRTGNPTRKAFEECMASSEGAKYGLAFSSGLAATATILNMYGPGTHIISSDDVYGGTRRLFTRVCSPNQGVEFSFVNTSDPTTIEAAIKPNTKLIWLETPTNPTLKISDIQLIAEIAHKHGVHLYADNTFCSPYGQHPIELGADVVIHSCTKYIGGHTDVVMGVVVTSNEDIYTKIKFLQNAIGAVPSPFDCFLAMRGMKTLHLRMKAHQENAMRVAQMLESHQKVQKVVYPGLPSHPQHEIAVRQMKCFTGMITFYLKGGLPEARKFLENTKLFVCAESLGAVECLMEHPGLMTHASVPVEVRAELGIDDSMIRLSIGVENIEDILQDIIRALEAV